MRTARTLTVSGGGASQKKLWGKENWKKKEKKKKKFGDPPPKNWRPPEKLETPLKNWRTPPGPDLPPCEQNHTRLWKYNLARTSLRAVINVWFVRENYPVILWVMVVVFTSCVKNATIVVTRNSIFPCVSTFILKWFNLWTEKKMPLEKNYDVKV